MLSIMLLSIRLHVESLWDLSKPVLNPNHDTLPPDLGSGRRAARTSASTRIDSARRSDMPQGSLTTSRHTVWSAKVSEPCHFSEGRTRLLYNRIPILLPDDAMSTSSCFYGTIRMQTAVPEFFHTKVQFVKTSLTVKPPILISTWLNFDLETYDLFGTN